MESNFVKVLFRYYSDVLEEEVVETMWSDVIDTEKGLYRLDSIPFYGPLIATDDIFYAEYDSNKESLVFKGIVEHSGNSIVQVMIMDGKTDKEIVREELKQLECLSEGLNDSFFSLEIVEKINYKTIIDLLEEYVEKGILAYAEPCLSVKHQNDIE